MGNAFHRKQLSINRTLTRGTGIRYIDPRVPMPHELTPAQIAAQAEKAVQRAMLEAQRQRTNEAINTLLQTAREILDAWKRGADQADKALAEFPGWWTTDSFCALPVNAEVAAFYATLVREYREFVKENGFRFDIKRLDDGIKQSTTRKPSTDQIVEDVLRVVRIAAHTAFAHAVFDGLRFINELEDRADQMQHLSEPLDVLCDALEPTLVGARRF